jgi:hypothetical protein
MSMCQPQAANLEKTVLLKNDAIIEAAKKAFYY